MTADAEKTIIEALRDRPAGSTYRQLEREYDLSSDEAVDRAIAANEYTFTSWSRWMIETLTSPAVRSGRSFFMLRFQVRGGPEGSGPGGRRRCRLVFPLS